VPGPIDFAFLVFFAVVLPVIEYRVFFPRFRAALAAGTPGARRNGYRRITAGQWLIAAAGVALFARTGRPWTDLGLIIPSGWRAAAAIAIAGAFALLLAVQLRSVARLAPEKLAKVRASIASLAFLLPHTREERDWFVALSVTAGICEEFLYRGVLIWTLRPSLGLAGAALASILLFGAGHAYQGPKHGIRATAAGIVMTAIVLLTGSLLPAMLVHASMDLGAGFLGYRLLNDAPSTG
jgi:membrane protease YdiL (CAAX protease family)